MSNVTSIKNDVVLAVPSAIRSIAKELFPRSATTGSHVRAGDIDGTPGTSFAMSLRPESAGLWLDHASGDRGDLLDLIQIRFMIDFKTALSWVAGRVGLSADMSIPQRAAVIEAKRTAPVPSPATPSKTLMQARKLWADSQPIKTGDAAHKYLLSRNIDLDLRDPAFDVIRWSPSVFVGGMNQPGLVVKRTSATSPSVFCGVHRIALNKQDGKRAKQYLGSVEGHVAVVRLSPDSDVETGLHICEGVETGLAALALGARPVWSCLDAGGIRRLPVLSGIESLTIFADADPVGIAAAEACRSNWSQNCEVRVFAARNEGEDLLDQLGAFQ